MRVSFQNSTGGELVGEHVENEDEAKAAALRLIEDMPFLNVGDKLVVVDD